jgi:hypothetical protein
MGQDEGGAGDGADLAGADSDVLKGAPSAGEQREPAFAQGTLGGVAGAGIDVEFPAIAGLFDGNVDAYSGALIAGVGQGGQAGGGGVVERGQGTPV